MNPKEWARKNKRKFANKMVTDSGAESNNAPAAFFMAGLPGAGKTEFTKNLIHELKLKVVRIDMDEIASHIDSYEPSRADAFREAATDVMNAVFDRTVHRKVDFIMDGTFRSKKAINNIERCLAKGYIVKVIYILQDPAIAWSFTQAREKVEKRAIERDGFLRAYYDIFGNLQQVVSLSSERITVDIVIKNEKNQIGELYKNVDREYIDDLVNNMYNKEELERRLQP